MAKKSLWQRISGFFKGGSSSGSSSDRIRRAVGKGNYGGGYSSSYRAYSKAYKEDEEKKKRKQLEEKNKQVTAKLAEIAEVSKRADSLSSGKKSTPPAPKEEKGSGVEKALKKISEKAKTPDNDPKHQALLESKKRGDEYRANLKKQNKEFNERTDHKYDVKYWKDKGDKEKTKQAQQLIKGGFDSSNAVADELAIKYHPIAYSATRGALSGTTFGLSEVVLRNQKGEGAEREKYYQEHKNRGAEIAGELVGSLASFGGVGKAAEVPAAKIVGSELGEKAVGKLATSGLTRLTAKRAAGKAAKKAGVELTDDLIKAVARRKAEDVAKGLTTSALIDASAGNLMNATMASRENEFGTKEWWKDFGKYGLLNAGISGGVSMLPVAFNGITNSAAREEVAKLAQELGITEEAAARRLLRGRLTVKGKANPLVRNADEAVESVANGTRIDEINRELNAAYDEIARNGDMPEEELGRLIKRTNDLKAERSALEESTQPIAEATARQNADEVAENVARQNADEIAENVARGEAPKVAAPEVETVENIKSKYPVVDATDGKGGTKWVVEMREGRKVKRFTVVARSQSKAYHAIADNNYGASVKVLGKNGKVAGKNVDVAASTSRLEEINAELEEIRRGIDDPNTSAAEKELLDKQSRPLHKEKNALEANLRQAEATAKEIPAEEVAEATASGTNPVADDIAEDIPFESGRDAHDIRADMREAQRTIDSKMATTEEKKAAEQRLADLQTELDTYMETLKTDAQNRAKNLGEQPGEWSRAKSEEQLMDEPLRVTNPAEAFSGETPKGVSESRSAYEYATGEEYVGADVKTSWEEAWNADREYRRSHSYGQRRAHSKTSVTQLQAATSDEQRRLITEAVERGDIDYNRIHTEEEIHKAAENFHSDPDRYIKDLIDINSGKKVLHYRDTPEWSTMAHYIMAVVDPSADASSEIAFTEAYKLASDIASKAGQSQNMRRHFVHLTPAGRRDSIMDELASMLYNSRGFNKLHPDMPRDKYDAINYIKAYLEDDSIIREKVQNLVEAGNKEFKLNYSQADNVLEEGAEGVAKNVDDLAQVESGMPGIDDVDVAHMELIEALNAHRPKTGFDVLQQMRYLFMLLNPKTHFRNIGGSGLFAPMRQLSNGVRSLIEKPLAEKYGVEVARHGGPSATAAVEARLKNPTSEAGQKAVAALEKRGKDFLGGMKYETETYTGRAKTLPGKVLDWLSDKNSWVLTKEDDYFKKVAFKENYIKSYNKYLKDKVPITPAIEKRIEEEAIQEAYIATFNEANDAAKALNRLTRQANDPHAGIGARWGARVVNAFMPFEKVPANISKQAINYSPLGLLRGAADIAKAGRAGDGVALNRAIDELASGLTGTGVFLLGAWLQKRTGMFTTNTGKNDPGAKFKKDRGMQNYSINFVDPETGQGTSITLDWLVPMSAVFFMGVEFTNQMSKGDFDLLSLGGDWATVTSRLAEPVLESSMLSGIHGALETMRGGYGDDDTKGTIDILLREAGQSYLNSLVPTALGQAARAFMYDSELQLPNEGDDWKYFKNQIKSKAGLGNTNILGEPLGADTDAYGNIKGEHHGAKENLLYFAKVGISPANIQKIDMSQVDQEKLRIYDEAVKNGADPNEMAYLFPKKQSQKKFSVGGEDVNMSNKEVSLYNQAKTKGGAEGMRYILDNSIIYNRYDYDSKGKKVPAASAYTREQKDALIKQFDGKSMREVEEWLYADPMFQAASPEEQKKVIKNLWTLTKDSNAVASQRVGEQAVFEAQGRDVNEYNYKNEVTKSKREKLDPLIESGLLTYEEIVDFERNGGKAHFTEDDEGGSVTTYYSKASMIEYFVEHGIPYEKAEALYNAYKNKNAKPYSGNNLYSGYGRRRYYGGYRHYGHGGGRSGKAKVPAPKKIAKGSLKGGEALVSKTRTSSGKSTTPTLARVEAKIDLPTAKTRTRRG